jgi:exodeoxyribonuclease V alpha subunit
LKENCLAVLEGIVRPSSPVGSAGSAGSIRRPPWVVAQRYADARDVQTYILTLFESVFAEQWGFDLLEDVQLLTPTHKGPLGAAELNVLLQRLLQKKLHGVVVPSAAPGRRPAFLLHDRVIQTRNNYDLDVMNGAIGVVTAVGPRRGDLTVRFEHREVVYTAKGTGTRDLALAYALTVHKVQGSEFPCAVVVVHKSHSFMHHRNLLYTAVTRARNTAVLVGDSWGLRNCAAKKQVDERRTFLSVVELHGRAVLAPVETRA